MDIIRTMEEKNMRNDLHNPDVGDYVQVNVLIKEGNRERIQMFEGTVISKRGGGLTETFTVRRISYGVGVEKVFPLHSPKIDSIKRLRKGKVRRAKLNYLRKRVGKASRVTERMVYGADAKKAVAAQKEEPEALDADGLTREETMQTEQQEQES